MRSLKECYEVAKKYHAYWAGSNKTMFMCLAAGDAFDAGALTENEYSAVKKDSMSLVRSLNKSEISLKGALGEPTDEEVKAFWDKYIDSMENQDG